MAAYVPTGAPVRGASPAPGAPGAPGRWDR